MDIELFSCNTGSSICEYFSDANGDRVNTTGSLTARRVSLVNNSANHIKGDINLSGAITTQDVGPIIQCAVYGQNSANCPLAGLSLNDYAQVADFNCSGFVTTQDVGPLIQYATGQTGNFKAAIQSKELSREGSLSFDFEGTFANGCLGGSRFFRSHRAHQ